VRAPHTDGSVQGCGREPRSRRSVNHQDGGLLVVTVDTDFGPGANRVTVDQEATDAAHLTVPGLQLAHGHLDGGLLVGSETAGCSLDEPGRLAVGERDPGASLGVEQLERFGGRDHSRLPIGALGHLVRVDQEQC
jgi:hypothetical protein